MRAQCVSADAAEPAALLAEARAGSNSSLGQLLANYRGYLLLVANQEFGTGLQAKVAPSDVAQETFLIAHQKFSSFKGTNEHEFRGWLRRILMNRYKDLWREFKEARHTSASREVSLKEANSWRTMDSLAADNRETPSIQAVATEELVALDNILSQLPEEQRTIVEMRNWERMTFVEIGKRLGKSDGAVRKIWGRAIKRLVEGWRRAEQSSHK